MVRFQELRREHIIASDGSIGAIYDLYFDDVHWRLRYFVVDTRRWLPGRKVLISPEAIVSGAPWDDGVPVNLTRDQVKSAPGFETELPVSRQNEEALIAYYQWAHRFSRRVSPALASTLPHEPVEVVNPTEADEPQLRSAREIIGYDVAGPDGPVGDVVDLRFDKLTFTIRGIEVDPRSQVGLPDLTVPPQRVREVCWNDSTILVDLDFGSLAGTSTGPAGGAEAM